MTKKILVLLAGASLVAGCDLAPKYIRPVGAAPERFPEGGAYPAARPDAPADISQIGWREFFTDPRLVAVIETGLANNRNLRIAAGNVLQARAQYRVQRADLLPTIAASSTPRHHPVSRSSHSATTIVATSAGSRK